MELRLSDILADPELGLTLVDGSPGALARHVRWVAVTELADPRPFLSGGELVLTTGLAQRTAAAQREFVTRIAACDVAGLGFGTRLTHNVVPAATLAAARAAGLPVLEVPYSTPFIAVDRFVADRILEEQYGRYHDLVVEQDTLARSLLSGRGLGALVESLQRILGAAVMVVDQQDNVLAGSLPSGAEVTGPRTSCRTRSPWSAWSCPAGRRCWPAGGSWPGRCWRIWCAARSPPPRRNDGWPPSASGPGTSMRWWSERSI
jgi:purine catabolism regulator